MLRVIEVYVRQPDQVAGAVRYAVEQLTSGEWHLREDVVVNGGTPGARRKFLLEPDERLVVEDISTVVVRHDPRQNSNHQVTIGNHLLPPPEETEYSSQMEREDAVASLAEGYTGGK